MVAGEFGVTRGCMKPLVTGGSGRDVLPKVWMNSLVSITFFVTRVMTALASRKSMLRVMQHMQPLVTRVMTALVSRKSMFRVMQPLVTRVIQALY